MSLPLPKPWPVVAMLLAACAPVAPAPAPGAPSPAIASASPSGLPGEGAASPSPVASSPSPALPSAAPTPAGFVAPGQLFRRYDWLGLGRPFYDRGTNRLYVADAVARKDTDRRYQLLRFDGSTGEFLGVQSALPTEPKGLEGPANLDGVTFDRRGVPLVAHVDKDQRFRLLELLSATVRRVEDFPVNDVPRVGPVSLASDGLVLTEILLRLDDDKNVAGNQRLLLTQAERNQPPMALVNMANPFRQLLHVAASPSGVGHAVGLRADGSVAFARLQGAEPEYTEISTLSRAPDGLFVDAQGQPLVVQHNTSAPAKVEGLNSQGQVVKSAELRLKEGGYLTSVIGLCADGQGGLFVTGRGLDAEAKPIFGLYRFLKPAQP